jgi:hypothetical protein
MPTICFENENLDYDYENNYLHMYELNEHLIIPCVGDIVDFDDDRYYEYRDSIGSCFVVTKKKILYSRGESYQDDCSIILTVEKAT